ncbi:amino acid adenylation domain-containing protein [Kitasatospora sp. NPDC058170]|uniref:amino acid adenylation domain-containing protein n=1 Tax=Kitasatospora sp. NPDC058170 TaxID=3346364 RepID=UPI0036DACA30
MNPTPSAAAATHREPDRHGGLIHTLFTRRAEEAPDARALVQGDTVLTYGQLAEASDAFAADLAAAGVAPGDLVPVLMPRSIRLVVAFLGILKCGAAYAALDPRWPQERLDRLVRLMGAGLTVTDGPPPAGTRAVAPGRPIPGRPVPVVEIGPDSPAAVFFTSGSTGEPKGALSPHAGTVRLFDGCPFAELGPRTVMPLTSAVPWDALTLELWSVLLNGGCSVVVDEPYLLPAALRELVAEHGVNCLSLTSTLFNVFVDEDPEAFAGVDQVFVGGEKVSPRHLAALLERFPRLRLLHCYGPVETTLFATVHPVRPGDCALPEGVPLGTAVPRTGLYVHDGERLCGPGETGELLISGDGLATGYLGAPERTAQAFPTVEIDGVATRVYRTGDLVHRTADGRLHFDGRADRQVKIRGHRVEPDEVERAAGALDGVHQCAAVPLPDGAGGCRGLALAFTTGRRQRPTGDELTAHLAARLPAYLVPHTVLRLDALPLNPNGKADAAALLRLVEEQRTTGLPGAESADGPADGAVDGPVDGPAGELERTVAAVFASVLGVDPVPVDAGFFDLGGTSLGLGVVCTRLTAALGLPLPVSEVIRRPNVRELAAWIGLRAAEPGPSTEPCEPTGSAEPGPAVPLRDAQSVFWARQAADPEDLSGLCPLLWHLRGPVDADALEAALGDLADRHEALRSVYTLDEDAYDPVPVAVPRPAPAGAGPLLRRLPPADGLPTAVEAARRALARPLDPEAGRVWRSVLVPLEGGADTLFGLAFHHIAFDGHSEPVFTSELSLAYAARARGERPVFAGPAPGLRQVERETAALAGLVDLKAQRSFWRGALRDTPELRLPLPGEGGPADRSAGVLGFVLEGPEAATVERLAAEHGTTAFTVLLATASAVLAAVTGQRDLAIGVPVSRRASPLLAAAVGCLVDTVCVRLDGGREGWAELVDGTRRAVTAALSNQDVSFAEVVRLVRPARTDRDPLYQFLFVYQDAPPTPLDLGPAVAVPVRLPAAQSVCEVVTEVWPRADGTLLVDITYRTDRVSPGFAPLFRDLMLTALRDGPPVRRR